MKTKEDGVRMFRNTGKNRHLRLKMCLVLAVMAVTVLLVPSFSTPVTAASWGVYSNLYCLAGSPGASGFSVTHWEGYSSSDWGKVWGWLWFWDGQWILTAQAYGEATGSSGSPYAQPQSEGAAYYVETAAHQASFFSGTLNTESTAKWCT